MSLWNKSSPPKNFTGPNKRNIVGTSGGWVRQTKYTDQNGHSRNKTEILVGMGGIAATTANPAIVDIFHSTNLSHANTVISTTVTFSEPLTITGTGKLKINITGANTVVATADAAVVGSAVNELVFKWKTSVTGDYQVGAQTASNTGAVTLTSQNGAHPAASLVISAGVGSAAGKVKVIA
jgi:hypothetical protein